MFAIVAVPNPENVCRKCHFVFQQKDTIFIADSGTIEHINCKYPKSNLDTYIKMVGS